MGQGCQLCECQARVTPNFYADSFLCNICTFPDNLTASRWGSCVYFFIIFRASFFVLFSAFGALPIISSQNNRIFLDGLVRLHALTRGNNGMNETRVTVTTIKEGQKK
jgi:hypothetical protein